MTRSLRQSIRSLLRTPVLSGVASMSVAISIALTSLILMVCRQSLLLSLPFPEPNRVVTVMASASADCGTCPDLLSSDALIVWQQPRVRSFSSVGLYRAAEFATASPPRWGRTYRGGQYEIHHCGGVATRNGGVSYETTVEDGRRQKVHDELEGA